MNKTKLAAAVLAFALTFSSTTSFGVFAPATPSVPHHSTPVVPWVVFGCAGGIITAAVAANYSQNRQVSWNEAASCGLLFWFTPPKKK